LLYLACRLVSAKTACQMLTVIRKLRWIFNIRLDIIIQFGCYRVGDRVCTLLDIDVTPNEGAIDLSLPDTELTELYRS